MSSLPSHVKSPFKRGGPVLQPMFRFISILTINGHTTTHLTKLRDEDFESSFSYDDFKKGMSNKLTLNDYAKLLASNFELRGCITVDYTNIPSHVQGESCKYTDFAHFPTDQCLNNEEINSFKEIIQNKRKLHQVSHDGLAKAGRLEPSYRHVMVDAVRQGWCVLCTQFKKESYSKYKCKTCGVFLCRRRMEDAPLSFVKKWHSNLEPQCEKMQDA